MAISACFFFLSFFGSIIPPVARTLLAVHALPVPLVKCAPQEPHCSHFRYHISSVSYVHLSAHAIICHPPLFLAYAWQVNCTTGHYSTEGQSTCTQCPPSSLVAGKACVPTSGPTTCVSGTPHLAFSQAIKNTTQLNYLYIFF